MLSNISSWNVFRHLLALHTLISLGDDCNSWPPKPFYYNRSTAGHTILAIYYFSLISSPVQSISVYIFLNTIYPHSSYSASVTMFRCHGLDDYWAYNGLTIFFSTPSLHISHTWGFSTSTNKFILTKVGR